MKEVMITAIVTGYSSITDEEYKAAKEYAKEHRVSLDNALLEMYWADELPHLYDKDNYYEAEWSTDSIELDD